jgi:DNA polymerase-3 subunit delta'
MRENYLGKLIMRNNNWQIIGHEWVIKSLRQHVSGGNIKHAYLFTGPESVGKRTVAIRFAQAVNCLNSTGNDVPCLDCKTCGQIERMVHPDLTIVKPGNTGGSLKVEQIREFQYSLHLAPNNAVFRVAILLDFENATENASNALLKTLEEPPDNVVILITAENAERLLPTIISRCEVIHLRPVPKDTLNAGIQNLWKISPEEADLLTQISGGRPGYCFNLYQSPELLEQRRKWIDDMNRLLASNRIERFSYAEEVVKQRNQLIPLLKTWLGFWRDVMLRSRDIDSQITNIDYFESIDQLAQNLQKDKTLQVVCLLDDTFYHLERNVNPRLAIEDLLLGLPFTS